MQPGNSEEISIAWNAQTLLKSRFQNAPYAGDSSSMKNSLPWTIHSPTSLYSCSIPASKTCGMSCLLRPVGCPVFCHVIQCHTQAECKTSVHSSQSAQYCNLDRADLRDGTTIPFDPFSDGQLWCYRNKRICGAGQLDPARDGAASWRPKARTGCSFYALSSVPLFVKVWSPHQQYSITQKPS